MSIQLLFSSELNDLLWFIVNEHNLSHQYPLIKEAKWMHVIHFGRFRWYSACSYLSSDMSLYHFPHEVKMSLFLKKDWLHSRLHSQMYTNVHWLHYQSFSLFLRKKDNEAWSQYVCQKKTCHQDSNAPLRYKNVLVLKQTEPKKKNHDILLAMRIFPMKKSCFILKLLYGVYTLILVFKMIISLKYLVSLPHILLLSTNLPASQPLTWFSHLWLEINFSPSNQTLPSRCQPPCLSST